MVVITLGTAATISLVSLLIGGTGVFLYVHYEDGEMPNIANSSFGKFDWHKTEKTDLIGVDFNLESGGVIWEVGMIIAFLMVILLFCCCGIKHLPTPRCIKERRKKNKEARREKNRKKKERLRKEEEEERLRKIWKHDRRNKEYYRKMSKKINDKHWAVRNLSEERRDHIHNMHRIHKLASGEGIEQRNGAEKHIGAEKHKIVEEHRGDREEEGNLVTTGMGETRSISRVDSSSVCSGTTATSTDWYCGRDIYTNGSVYSYDMEEGEEEKDEGRSSRSSDTVIDFEQ